MVGIVAVVYAATLVWLVATGDMRWVRFALVPGATLVLVSVVRKGINAARPYEAHNVDPLLPAKTKGQSMPSRHVTCAVVIACAMAWLNITW